MNIKSKENKDTFLAFNLCINGLNKFQKNLKKKCQKIWWVTKKALPLQRF